MSAAQPIGLPQQHRSADRLVRWSLWAFVLLLGVGFSRLPLGSLGIQWMRFPGAIAALMAHCCLIVGALAVVRARDGDFARQWRLWMAAVLLLVVVEAFVGVLRGTSSTAIARDMLVYASVVAAFRLGGSGAFWRVAKGPLVGSIVVGLIVLLSCWHQVPAAFEQYGIDGRIVRAVSVGRTAVMLGALPLLLFCARQLRWPELLVAASGWAMLTLCAVLLQRRLDLAFLVALGAAAVAIACVPAALRMRRATLAWWSLPTALCLCAGVAATALPPEGTLVAQGEVLLARLQGRGLHAYISPEALALAQAEAEAEGVDMAIYQSDPTAAASVAEFTELTQGGEAMIARFGPAGAPLVRRGYTSGALGPLTRENERFQVVGDMLRALTPVERLVGRGLGGAFPWGKELPLTASLGARKERHDSLWLEDQQFLGRREVEVGMANPILKGGIPFALLMLLPAVAAVGAALRRPRNLRALAVAGVVAACTLYTTMGGSYLANTAMRDMTVFACAGWLLSARRTDSAETPLP